MTISVLVPKLPSVVRLLPYLREIEIARTHFDFGHRVSAYILSLLSTSVRK